MEDALTSEARARCRSASTIQRSSIKSSSAVRNPDSLKADDSAPPHANFPRFDAPSTWPVALEELSELKLYQIS